MSEFRPARGFRGHRPCAIGRGGNTVECIGYSRFIGRDPVVGPGTLSGWAAGPRGARAPAARLWRAAAADRRHGRHAQRLGIGRGDRVAIVLPNGPEMAAAFLAIGAGADHRAAQPGLPRGRVRVLSAATSMPRRWSIAGRHGEPGARRRAAGAASRSSSWCRTGRPAGALHPAGDGRGERGGAPAAGARRTTSRWCCTPRAPRRGPRSCR